MLTFGSLFSGIGGIDLGLERAGMLCRWQVEIDDYATKVLANHWPDVARFRDIRECGAHNLERVDVLAGGFPCQDVSVAGNRAGLAGERSGLWHEFHRILGELKPRWAVIENVPGLLSSNGGRDFETILRGLEECGYRVSWRTLDAQYFGVAQRRRRVFIVGSLGDGSSADILFEREGSGGDTPPRRETGQGTTAGAARGAVGLSENQRGELKLTEYSRQLTTGGGKPGQGYAAVMLARAQSTSQSRLDGDSDNFVVAATLNSGGNAGGFSPEPGEHLVVAPVAQSNRGHVTGAVGETLRSDSRGAQPIAFAWHRAQISAGITSPTVTVSDGHAPPVHDHAGGFGVRRLTPIECERLQGFPDGWTDNGQSDSARYRQLGNAVCVPVAEWIGRRLAQVAA